VILNGSIHIGAVTDSLTVSSNIVFIHAVPCRGCWSTTHVKLIVPRMTAIAGFEQRWRQREKMPDCSFLFFFSVNLLELSLWETKYLIYLVVVLK